MATTNGPPVIRRTLADQVAPPHTAVLLIDMVNDLVDPAGKAAQRAGRPIGFARAAIGPQRRLLAAARAARVPVVYVNHTTLPDRAGASGPWLAAREQATYSVEDLCLAGSWGGQVIEELAPQPGDLTVGKFRYSGFAGTNLDLLLRSAGVETVICAGVSTNACVEATAREAFSHDYYVVYPWDACASWDPALHEATLATAAHRYATVATVAEIAAGWAGHAPAEPESVESPGQAGPAPGSGAIHPLERSAARRRQPPDQGGVSRYTPTRM